MGKEVTVLCVGNYLMGDEGVGVHFARMLEKEKLPEGVTIIDGGSGGFKLLEYLNEANDLVMIDATLDDQDPGTIRLIRPRFASDFPKAMSTHEIGLKDLVESSILLGRLPTIYLFTISINTVQPLSIELSPEVSACLPVLRDQVIGLVERLISFKLPSELSCD
jgi:hydrogenase maturation protease